MATSAAAVRGVSLRGLFPDASIFGADDVRAESVCGQAENCRAGDLFAALPGDETDGHEQALQAVQNGASAVLAERLLPLSVPMCVVSDVRAAYGRLCHELTGSAARTTRLIGVTGTNGKTTTAMLLRSILRAAGRRVGSSTSLGFDDGIVAEDDRRQLPSPPELARRCAEMDDCGCDFGIVEAESRSLARGFLDGLELDGAVLTNARAANIEFHGSVLNYRRAESRIFRYLSDCGFAVLNADDPASKHLLGKLTCPLLTVGLHSPAELEATIVERHAGEQTFLLGAGSESIPVRTRMIGDHHVYNCLSAAAVAMICGVDLATVARGIEAVDSLPLRLQRIECGQDFAAYVDAADTPDRVAMALKTARRVAAGRVFCVVSGAAHVPADQRALLGRVTERGADVGVITTQRGLPSSSLAEAHQLLDGYDRPARAHVMPDRDAAVCWALDCARAGDAVIVAGATEADRELVHRHLRETHRPDVLVKFPGAANFHLN